MDRTVSGWISGFIGMVIFSGSLPATRLAVLEFDPVFLTGLRAVIAGLLGLAVLLLLRQRRPSLETLPSLIIVALGVVIGFPLLTALALQYVPSAHSILFIGLLPLATATFGFLRAGERPQPAFWLFSAAGAAMVAGYSLAQGIGSLTWGDPLMLAAIVVCGLGYAEGGRVSRSLGGWQVISWALVLSLPVTLAVAWVTKPLAFDGVSTAAWGGLAYVSLFSMLIGFVFWYRGLALGGIAAVGQLQLLQPFFGLTLAALVVGEAVSWAMLALTLCIVGCVAGARRFALTL